jgi:hypothetical protein
MDDFQTRALKNLRERHESRITENAERIREHIGYLLERIKSGRADATGMYAADIATAAGRIVASVVALDTLKESAEIMATSETPATEPLIVPIPPHDHVWEVNGDDDYECYARPGDAELGNERWRRLPECADCARRYGRGALLEVPDA